MVCIDSGFRRIFLAAVICLFASGKQAQAFDAGHHHDITRSVLSIAGFAEGATNSVILANWLTDYYSNAPSSNPRLRPFLQTMHFDNLRDGRSVRRYHGWLIHNTRRLTREAAKENDRIKLLALIGIASHAIQDFYSHSNWIGKGGFDDAGDIRVSLYPVSKPPNRDVFTGTWPRSNDRARAHGSYTFGINKDSHIRPGWEDAYVHAFQATARLVRNIELWAEQVRPGFWRRTARINPARLHQRQLLRDLNSAREISMSVRAKVLGLPASDGHWKGNLSGDSAALTSAVSEFAGWKNSFMTRYFRTSRLVFDLADKLMSTQEPPPVELVPAGSLARQALVFKIHSFVHTGNQRAAETTGISLTVNGTNYTGRKIRNRDFLAGEGPAAWTEMHIGKPGVSKYQIELVMNGYRGSGNSNVRAKDINFRPGKNKLELVYNARSGELSGDVHVFGAGKPQRITIAGDGNSSVRVVLSVYTRKLVVRD